MQKNLRLTIAIMALFSVVLLFVIFAPSINGSIEAASNNVDSFNADVVDSTGKDSTTKSAIENQYNNLSDVTCEIIEPSVTFQLKYESYPLTYLYLLTRDDSTNIRKGPSVTEPVIKTLPKNEKLNYIETITNDGNWYHVVWVDEEGQYFGFVSAEAVNKRVFQFDKMMEAIQKAEKALNQGTLTYINNYRNLKGRAPSHYGQDVDASGNRRSQSAPGYPDLNQMNKFTYIGDGTLVRIVAVGAEYTSVALVKNDNVYYVPNKYIAIHASVYAINKAVVVDRSNQNEVVFEKINQEWKVISFSLATTGTIGKYQQPTPLGYFNAIEKRERFYYYKDGTTKIQGYAPYAIRFAGGAYVHGVPVNYKFSIEGNRIDPGKIEYSKSLGTIPLSHKCVRNYTSHAKFIYDWFTPGETIVIVTE